MKNKICLTVLILTTLISSPSFAFTTTGFQDPYGVVMDEEKGKIYVSNMNGTPDSQDGNGYISRLAADGTVEQLKFIESSQKAVLNAPKGMEITNKRIYVADIDKIRVYELDTGAFVYTLNFGDYPAANFIDIKKGGDGALYVTDSKNNTVYRIDPAKKHEVTQFVFGDWLGSPHGICYYPTRQFFVLISGSTGELIELDDMGKRQVMPTVFAKGLESCTADMFGSIYLTNPSMESIFRLTTGFAMFPFSVGQAKPMGLAYNKATKELIAVLTGSNSVATFSVEQK